MLFSRYTEIILYLCGVKLTIIFTTAKKIISKKTYMVISDYYKQLDLKQKIAFRDEVCEKAGVAECTFYHKLRNNSWRKGELFVIKTIIGKTSRCSKK